MNSAWRRTRTLPLTMTCITATEFDLTAVRCPGCGGIIAVHQPDFDEPGRLLGVCEGCGQWSELRFESEGVLLMLELPACPAKGWDGPDEARAIPVA